MRKLFTFTRGPTNRTRTAAALAAVGALVMAGGVVMLGIPGSSASATEDGADKVSYCHWDNGNDYGNHSNGSMAGLVNGHMDHSKDIWPAFTYKDKSYDAHGDQSILQNGCVVPGQEDPPDGKISYCHWDNGNEYGNHSNASISGLVNGHMDHANDIWPAFTYKDKSYDAHGDQSILQNGCVVPETHHWVRLPDVSVNDPCGPANATWVVPANDATFTWKVENGHLIVTIVAEDTYFIGTLKTTHDYGLAADSNAPCPNDVTINPPAAPATADPCGPANIHFIGYADTTQYDYTLLANGNVTVAPQPGYVFSGPTQLVTFILPADSNVPCPSFVTIDPPGAPSTTDPCGPANISFNVPVDTAQLDYTLLANGDVTVAPQSGYVFSGPTQLVTFTLPADSGIPCPLAAEEIEPVVTFTDPTCKALDGADWSGTYESIVKYTVTGKADLGESIEVTASIRPAYVGEYVFPDGFDATFEHTYPTLAELDCVLGEETVVPSPKPEHKPPVVLGTEAAVPTGVNAGLVGLPDTGSTSHTLLAQLMVGSGLVLLVAGGWLGFGRREYGGHQL